MMYIRKLQKVILNSGHSPPNKWEICYGAHERPNKLIQFSDFMNIPLASLSLGGRLSGIVMFMAINCSYVTG